MIILIYGQDTYRSNEKLKDIVAGYKEKNKSGVNINFLEKKDKASSLFDYDQQISMFEEKRLVISTDGFSDQAFKEEVIKRLSELLSSDNIFVFHQREELRKNDKIINLFKREKEKSEDKIMIKEYPLLKGKELLSFIKRELQRREVSFDDDAVYQIEKMCQGDTWKIIQEVEKLSLYAKKGVKITNKEVLDLVSQNVNINIFNIIEAVANKEKATALELVYQYFQKQENPHYLLSMIVYQFRNLIIVKDLAEQNLPYHQMAKESGLHPFVLSKTYQLSKKFSFQELKDIYNQLFKIDITTKTGQADPVLSIQLFVSEVTLNL